MQGHTHSSMLPSQRIILSRRPPTLGCASNRRIFRLQAAQAAQATPEAPRADDGEQAAPVVVDTADSVPKLDKASNYIYERNYGRPVVRERITFNAFLRDVRKGIVKEVRWFPNETGASYVDGPCLVVYKGSGKVKQANIPLEAVRARFAMETHGVANVVMEGVPDPVSMLPPSEISELGENALKLLPAASLLLFWALVQFKETLKGDIMDRAQLRKKLDKDRKAVAAQQKEDLKITNITSMVRNGYSDDEIRQDIKRIKMVIGDEELQSLITASRLQAKRQAAGSWNSEFEEDARVKARQEQLKQDGQAEGGVSADAMGRMGSMQIRKARMRRVNSSKMKGRLKNIDDDDVFFEDVAGISEAKQELQEIVDFFNFPARFAKSGARAPRGVMLHGPPGTGKTLLARAVAGEADATFVGVNASEFVEMFVGVGAARVRDLFETARENAPAVIFIDEIDAVGRVRGGSQGNDERDQTLNQMLSEMDGFDVRSGIVVIAATNRLDVLDPALIRPGRFDRKVMVGLPGLEGRIEVLRVHLNKREWDEDDVKLKELAFETQQFTGAMIANLVNTGALICAREERSVVMHRDLEAALDMERTGLKKIPYTDKISSRLALVEGACALAATLLPCIEPVVSVTVRPSEKSPLGQTILKIDEQRELTHLYTRRYLEEQLVMVLTGRAAEQVLLGEDEMSSLNARNIGYARRIVNKLVVASAMSENPLIGPRTISKPAPGADRSIAQIVLSRVSGQTLSAADFEMEDLLRKGSDKARALIERNRKCLEVIVDKLSKDPYEVTGAELEEIVEMHAHKDDLAGRHERDTAEVYF